MAKNINKMLKQAQKMQAQLLKAQEDMNKKEVEGTSGGGMVKVVLNGSQELQSLSLNPEVVDPDDVEMLEDLIIAAFQNAQEKIKEMSESTFGGITSGLNIPGLT
jgi:DNA-binding YbaB/EbfC family protein